MFSKRVFLAIQGVALLILTGIVAYPAPLGCFMSSSPADVNQKPSTIEMAIISSCGTTVVQLENQRIGPGAFST